jgi:hypothetical protein
VAGVTLGGAAGLDVAIATLAMKGMFYGWDPPFDPVALATTSSFNAHVVAFFAIVDRAQMFQMMKKHIALGKTLHFHACRVFRCQSQGGAQQQS